MCNNGAGKCNYQGVTSLSAAGMSTNAVGGTLTWWVEYHPSMDDPSQPGKEIKGERISESLNFCVFFVVTGNLSMGNTDQTFAAVQQQIRLQDYLKNASIDGDTAFVGLTAGTPLPQRA